MENVIRIALLGLLCQIGFCLRIENVDDTNQREFIIMAQVDEDLTLKCRETFEATDENFGVNPLKWHKIQKPDDVLLDDPEMGIEVSSIGSVHSTFADTGRVSASFANEGQNLDVNLRINGVKPEDSGWYFCYAKKGQEVVKIRYEVQVYVAPSSLMLSGRPQEGHNESGPTGPLTFYSNQGGILTCTAVGGYPAPTLRLHIEGEQNQLSGHGNPTMEYYLQGETEGLQHILYNTSVTVKGFEARADQNGGHVVCSATPPTTSGGNGAPEPVVERRTLSVLFPPKILQCSENWEAAIGDGNIKFWCKFESNPVPNVTWRALTGDPNVMIHPDGKIVDELYSAQVKVTSEKASGNVSVFETILTLEEITKDSFHRYELNLANDIGMTQREFLLDQGESGQTGGSVGSASLFSSSPLLIFTLFTLVASIFRR